MALYSWFLRTDNKPKIKSVRVNSDLLKASNTVKYIENYTMWPTAKIKPDVEITLPNYGKSKDKSLKHHKTIIPINRALTVVKAK